MEKALVAGDAIVAHLRVHVDPPAGVDHVLSGMCVCVMETDNERTEEGHDSYHPAIPSPAYSTPAIHPQRRHTFKKNSDHMKATLQLAR